jgi:alginate O-acetyltransferase complex protein AlgI
MLFTSTVFLILFLPIVFLVYFLLPDRFRNLFLLLTSLFFYAWGEVFYAGIILVSIGFNYLLTRAMAPAPAGGKRKLFLVTAIVLNLGLLCWFKYANFIIENINALLTAVNIRSVQMEPVHLPLGISFFTFQALCYVIDVYLGRVDVQKRFVNLALYISLFPQLIAGPIVRYRDIAKEILHRTIDIDRFAYGIRRFIIGMGKKMILANPLGEVADTIFLLQPGELTTPLSWLGISCYTLQIYFDFSGYSDMAIGLGRMLGFTFPENFNYPYISQSIREHWRRWHISLTIWFRDYLYIPLGGSRCSWLRTQLNLWIVFILCGLWHGPSWNYVIWGGIHGFFMVLERGGFERVLQRIWRPFRHAYMFLVLVLAFVFFRTETIPEALSYFSVMFGIERGEAPIHIALNLFARDKQLVFAAAILGMLPLRSIFSEWWEQIRPHIPDSVSTGLTNCRPWMAASAHAMHLFVLIGVFTLSFMHVAAGTYNPFIYFRF